MPFILAAALLVAAVRLTIAIDWSAGPVVWLELLVLAPFAAVIVVTVCSWLILLFGHLFRSSGRLPMSPPAAGR